MILTTNTLYDISKHTNKTIKVADYLSKANQPILFNKMAMVNSESSEIAFMEAFNKDLAETTKKLEDVHQLLSTVNDDGHVIHLKGETSLDVIFGESYDKIKQTIQLPFGEIKLKEDLERDSLKKAIVEKFLDISIEEYNVLFKAKNKIFSHPADQLYSDDDKIIFLSTVKDRSKYDKVILSIKDMSEKYTVFRKELTLEQKSLVDDQITFQRTMLDSIIKNSTYITKKDGIVQVASGHKKQTSEINELVKELKENKYIDSIEIDADTKILAFTSLMKKIKKVNLNLNEAICLKSRKNYGVEGKFLQNYNIVSLDVKTPSAAMAQLVKVVDYNDKNINNSLKRNNFASKMRSLLDFSDISYNDKYRMNSTSEIISRSGEFAFLLESHDFNDKKETIKDFVSRVEKEQVQLSPFDLKLVKPISYYTERANEYFNFEEMKNEDLQLMRDYFKSYFRLTEDLEITPLKSVVVPNHVKHKVIGERKKYEISNVALINKENIVPILEYNEDKKIIDPEILFYEILSKPFTLDRTTKTMSQLNRSNKIKIVKEMCEWVGEQNDLYLVSRLAEARVKSDKNLNIKPYFMAERLINSPKEIKGNSLTHLDEYITKAEPLYKEINEITYKRGEESVSEYHNRRRACQEKYSDTVLKTTILKSENEIDLYLKENGDYEKLSKVIDVSDRTLDDPGRYVLSQGMNRFYSQVDKVIQGAYDKEGSKIFNYFSEKDLFPLVTISSISNVNKTTVLNSNFQSYLIEKKHDKTLEPYHKSKDLIGLIDEMGQLKPLIKNINMISVDTLPHLVSAAADISNYQRVINKIELYKDENEVVFNINAFDLIFDNKRFDVEKTDLTYKIASEISDYKFDDYKKIQEEVKERRSSYQVEIKEIEEAIPEKVNKLEDVNVQSLKETLISEISKKDNTAIDPNEKIEGKSKKNNKSNPNQLKLF